MKKTLFGIYLFCLTLQAESAYVQVTSVETQSPVPETGSFILFDSADVVKNFTVSSTKDVVTCQIPGCYIVYSCLQPAVLARGIYGYLDTWFEINGNPIPSSNIRQYVDEQTRVSVFTNVVMANLKQGDMIGVKFLASRSDIGIIFIQSSLTSEPSVPSYGFSVYKIY
jgi:hypothetical protein